LIDKYGIKVITTNEVRRNGAESVSKKVLRYLSDCSDIYISFDVDSLDSSISKGTGTPVSNGLKEREAEDLISKKTPVLIIDINEVEIEKYNHLPGYVFLAGDTTSDEVFTNSDYTVLTNRFTIAVKLANW
jgi:hypothetical protein